MPARTQRFATELDVASSSDPAASERDDRVADGRGVAPDVLRVRGLRVDRRTRDGAPGAPLLRGVDLTVRRGEILGLVGESGCGKSLTALAILGLLPAGVELRAGTIELEGRSLGGLSEGELRELRASRLAMVFQEPMASLDPLRSIGRQLEDVLRAHRPVPRRVAREEAIALLEAARFTAAEQRYRSYPHELSGGEAQRVCVALALANEPQLLIADEPTTALDVLLEDEIVELFASLEAERRLSLLLISHDLAVVRRLCHRVAILYCGRVVEEGPVEEVLRRPAHPYTHGLLASVTADVSAESWRPPLPGGIPAPDALPDGCAFHPRCRLATPRCRRGTVPWRELSPGHGARCLESDRLRRPGCG